MGASRFPSAERAAAAVLLTACLWGGGAVAGARLDRPVVWHEDDRRPIPMVAEREPHWLETGLKDAVFRPSYRFFYPGRWLRHLARPLGADHVMPAANVNELDEAPDSTWFTNRLGMFPLTPERCADGPGGDGPDRSEPWRIIGAKIGGVTPGFRVRDARGDVHLIKFDPPGYTGLTVGAGIVANRILWAAGYNVSRDEAVTFGLDDVVVEPGVALRLPGGGELELTPARLDSIMTVLQPESGGEWRALSSQFVDGRPVGFFDYQGRRGDDANDRVRHENRRELRGLRLLSAWLNHFDTKQENSLDVFVETEPGEGYVQHYLIDFASTVGAAGRGPDRKWGYEYTVDPQAIMGNLLSLGLHESPWRTLQRDPALPEVGYWDVATFEPGEWKPLLANSAFANMTDRDAYWAAKIMAGFTDEHLAAIVAEARYADPRAAAAILDGLQGRRDRCLRYAFERVTPLDHFTVAGGELRFRDLGVAGGVYPATGVRYEFRTAACDVERRREDWSEWLPVEGLAVVLPADRSDRYLAVEVRLNRGDGWQGPVRVFVEPAAGRVAALKR